MDGPPPVQGHPGKPAHGGPPPVQDRSDEPAPELEPPRDDPVPDRDDPAGASASDLDDSLHEVDTGILGDLVGAHVDGEWVSANYPLEWYAEGGELPWLSFNELLEMATEAYKNFRAEQRALLSSSSGQVRRWGEWREGRDRWHQLDGSKKANTISTSSSASSSSLSSSDAMPPGTTLQGPLASSMTQTGVISALLLRQRQMDFTNMEYGNHVPVRRRSEDGQLEVKAKFARTRDLRG